MKKWILLAGAVVTEVSASLALKAALDHPAWYALVLAGYTASFVFLSGVLRTGMPLGVAYGIWGALGVASTALLGAAIYGEALSAITFSGLALIIGGVLLVEIGHHAAERVEV